MKKLFTLIAITSAIIPALHAMDTQSPTDVQKKYDNLSALIKNADIDAFKPSFDALTLPAESIAALRQTIVETKAAITAELETMGDTTKSWSKITKGSLATFGGFWAGISIPAALYIFSKIEEIEEIEEIENPIVLIASLIASVPTLIPSALIVRNTRDTIINGHIANIIPCALLSLGAAYKSLACGIKTFKAGWNYKEHLQNMLANLDAIDAHITQAKA